MAYTIPSAEAPLENLTTKLIPVLENEGIYAFLRRFPELVNALRSQSSTFSKANVAIDQTLMNFTVEFKQNWNMARLTTMIPKDLLKSILGGTVAFDSYKTPTQDWYPAQGPGVFVVGLQVDGRQGKFLCRKEIEALVVHLAKYCSGYLAAMAGSPASHADIDFTRRIDGQLTNARLIGKTRFIKNQVELSQVRCPITGLERRCSAQLDPTGLVLQVQTPLYVGSSDKLEERSKDYLNRNITKINKPLGLVLSILEFMNLRTTIAFRVASPCYEDLLMPRGERLVAVLASAYVSQDGFNVTEAVGKLIKATIAKLEEAELQVKARFSHMENNINAISADADKRIQYLQDLGQLEKDLDELTEMIDRCAVRQMADCTTVDIMPMLEAEHEILRLEMVERRRQARQDEFYLEMLKIMYGDVLDI